MKHTKSVSHILLTFIYLLLAGASSASDENVWIDKGQFASPAIQFKPRPLWFWNNTAVNEATVREQTRLARDRSGYGGFGILPFGRQFSPAYLSKDYFAVYGAALDEAKNLGMTMSLYDEFGFPSGSAGSQNSSDTSLFAKRWPGLTIKRLDKHEWEITSPGPFEAKIPDGQLAALVAMNTKTLERRELSALVKDRSIAWNAPDGPWKIMAFMCVTDGETICDYLDPEAADRFIELTHQAYYDRFSSHFGKTIDSSFFDEPTLYRAKGRTWTDKFNEKFQAYHGFDPRPYYPALWYDIGPDTQAARNYLFGFRTELYATAFTKRIQEWCAAHGIAATGHQDQEEVVNPVSVSGDLMKCFQYLEIPGIDKIGGDRPAEKFYKVVSSAAYNWDRSLVMSETYGAMGDLSWDAIHAVAMEQYTKGINKLIPHAVWYDNSKVTFKPELSWRHPAYAEGLPAFNTYLARLNVMLQNNAAHVADIAVLYPISTMQGSHYLDGPLGHYKGGVAMPDADYVKLGELLSVDIGQDYTFLHPEVLTGRCKIEGGSLILPNKIHPGRFSIMILPGHETIHWSALKQIQSFYKQGGCVIATGKLPSKSAEFGKDKEVKDAIESMFGETGLLPEGLKGNVISSRYIESGGHAIRIHDLTADSLRRALDKAKKVPDVSFAPGTALRYIHKTANGRHIFFFANLNSKLSGSNVTLRGHHQLEAWDPHTGNTRQFPVKHTSRDGIDITEARLDLPHLKSVFLVSSPPPSQRPNVLFLFSDDQRHDTIHALGNETIRTPHIDRLVGSGVAFRNAYIMGASSPAVCSPSRACLMSGRTLWNIECQGEFGFEISAKYKTIPQVFRENGYVTFGTGKNEPGRSGAFGRSFSTGDKILFRGMTKSQYKLPLCAFSPDGKYPDGAEVMQEGTHSAEVYADACVQFLEGQGANSQPFFAYVAFQTPHDPRQCPPDFREMYQDEKMKIPASFMPRHPFDNGMLDIRDEKLAPFPRTEQVVRKHLADYYSVITHTDVQIGRILDALEKSGKRDNTIIVFSSDNGLAMGSHGLMGKQNVYEPSVHVPLIIAGPGIPKGETRDALCYIYDLYPTLCERAGLNTPDTVQFQSLNKVIDESNAESRDHLYYAFMSWQRAVRDKQYKLIEYCVGKDRHTQMFDLTKDPQETQNLANDAANAATLERLRKLLQEDRVRLNDGNTPFPFSNQMGKDFWSAYDASVK